MGSPYLRQPPKFPISTLIRGRLRVLSGLIAHPGRDPYKNEYKIRGTFLGGPHIKDYSILWSIWRFRV